ncbi:MAG TPA: CoA transferase, partial [Acidimicrobiia bacterium]|nr:CoA transferase [Acidimicrobiia bacterium]
GELEQIFRDRPSEEWVRRLEAAGLPVGRLLDLSGVVADPQVRHNQMVVETDHLRAGRIRGIGSALRIDGTPALAAHPAPVLGEDTRSVLTELGAGDDEIDRLVKAGAVVVS